MLHPFHQLHRVSTNNMTPTFFTLDPILEIKKEFAKFAENIKNLDLENKQELTSFFKTHTETGEYYADTETCRAYEYQRKQLVKKFYTDVKEFFDVYKDNLTPQQKSSLFNDYIKLWKAAVCKLDIQDLKNSPYVKEEYAQQSYNNFSLSQTSYNEFAPMTAGFNLAGACFKSLVDSSEKTFNFNDLIFLSVNFKGADFSNVNLTYSDFHNCDLSDVKTDNTNFCKNLFRSCNLEKADLSGTLLDEAKFVRCNLNNAKLQNQKMFQVVISECNLENANFQAPRLKMHS